MATKIMIIRHGEKPSTNGSVHGVDENGSHDADGHCHIEGVGAF